MIGSWKSGHLIAALMIFIVLTTVIKVYINAHEELAKGHQAMQEGNTFSAVEHFERAIRWHLPVGSPAGKAAGQLWQIAQQQASSSETQKAIDTLRQLRAAFYGSRSFYTPGTEWIERCNEKIAELMSLQPPLTRQARSLSQEERRKEYLELLRKERPPHREWMLLSQVVFFGWIACLFLFIFRAITPQGGILKKPAMVLSFGWVVCFTIWVFALSKV